MHYFETISVKLMRSFLPRASILSLSVALIALSAQIKFNLGPVPYTMQNMGITIASLLLPPLDALMSVLIYISLIAIGLPLASGMRGGISVLIGYTSGYIWGFAISAPLMSMLSRAYLKRKKIPLRSIGKREAAALLLISVLSFIPTYLLGYLVFLRYAVPSSSLYLWSSNVASSIGFSSENIYLMIFAASVLIFLPQDVLMDQTIGIALAKEIDRFLHERGIEWE